MLEFFFYQTAPQLAGYFETGFFQGSVLQLSLTEPVIRQAIGAIGIAHERAAIGDRGLRSDENRTNAQIKLYNRSIRAAIDKVSTGPNASAGTLPLIAMANVLFTCFEVVQGNLTGAAAHVKGGLGIFRQWRDANGDPTGPWGRKYISPEAWFMETEIAPLLALFNTNSVECGGGGRSKLLLNSVNEQKGLFLGDSFETLEEARVGLIDMVTYATRSCTGVEHDDRGNLYLENDTFALSQRVKRLLDKWNLNFQSLLHRQNSSWNRKKQRMVDVINITKLSTTFGIVSFSAQSEYDWDLYRDEYVQAIQVIDAIVSDQNQFPDSLSRTMSLDAGMIFPLHAAAWKCRWPKLRRQGLDLLLRTPRRAWLFEAAHYHAIFSRIMEIEEAELKLPPGTEPDEDWLPPEHVRITDWIVTERQGLKPGAQFDYDVTFFSMPNGDNGPMCSYTQSMRFEFCHHVESAVPTNMISRE